MSERLLRAIISRLSPENRAGFLAEISRQQERDSATEPYLRQIRAAPTRAQAAAVLFQLRRLVGVPIDWSAVNAAIHERWSASAVRWCAIRAAKLDREERQQRAGR